MAEWLVNSKALRILQVLHDYPPRSRGGTEEYCHRSALALADRGHRVFVVCGDQEAASTPAIHREEVDGLPLFRIRRAHLLLDHWDKSHSPEVEALFQEVLDEVRPDLVHVHHWLRLTRTLVACSHEAGIPALVTLHDLWSGCPRCFRLRDGSFCSRPMGAESCRDCVSAPAFYEAAEVDEELERYREDLATELSLARRVLVPTEAHRAASSHFTPLRESEITVLPHGTLSEGLEPSQRGNRPGDGFLRLGHWGHLDRLKGVHLLLEAARLLRSRERGHLEIHLFGTASDPDYDRELRSLAKGLRVIWHGAYRPSDLSLLPLDWAVIPSMGSESWSFVLDEAFALGLPVIASRRGALEERVGAAGLLFDAESAFSLARILRRVLEDDGLRESCAQHFPRLESMAQHAGRIEGIYRQVIAEAGELPTTPAEVRGRRKSWSDRRLEIRYRQLLHIRGRLAGEAGRVSELEHQLTLASGSVADAHRSVESHSLSIAQYRNALRAKEDEMRTLEEKLRAQHELEVASEAKLSSLEREREELLLLRDELSAKLERAKDEAALAQQSFDRCRATFEERLREGEAQLEEEREQRSTLEAELETLLRNEELLAESRSALEAAQAAKAALRQSLEAQWEESGEMARSLASARRSAEKASQQRDREQNLRRELEELESQLEEYRALLPGMESRLKELGEEAERGAQASAQLDRAQVQLKTLEESLAAVRGELEEGRHMRAAFARMREELELGPADPGGSSASEDALTMSAAVAGMRRHLEESAEDLERIRNERDVQLAAREGAEGRAAAADAALARMGQRWWAPLLGVGKEREEMRRSGGSLRILMVIHQFLPRHAAGSEVYTYNLAKELSRRHDVELLFTEAHYGIPQYRVRRGVYDGLAYTEVVHQHAIHSFPRSYSDPRMEGIFERVLDRFRPDVVHLQHLHYFSVGCLDVIAKRGIPIVFTLHEYMLLCPRNGRMRRSDGSRCERPEAEKCGECIAHLELDPAVDDGQHPPLWQRAARFVPPEARQVLKALLPPPAPRAISQPSGGEAHRAAAQKRLDTIRASLSQVDLFIAPSRFLRGRFLDAEMMNEEKIVYSDYGMDPQRFTGVERSSSEHFRVGFIGSTAEFKGVHVLVDAMNLLEERKEIVCRIYGKLEHFPEYAAELRARIKNPSIELMGAYDNREVGRVLGDLDVLVVPSLWYENSPLTIHEAWLAGLPVVTSRLGGMAELVRHERSGLLFDTEDPEDLARQLCRLADDPGLRAQLSDCHRLVKSIEDDSRDMEGHYRRLLIRAENRGVKA